ncbi:hypothetical protein ON010_g15999 [Phytophthora cinnamomi]|nr:hypothetical protein ON010_g15999 [Phytophthora cinnamomi]
MLLTSAAGRERGPTSYEMEISASGVTNTQYHCNVALLGRVDTDAEMQNSGSGGLERVPKACPAAPILSFVREAGDKNQQHGSVEAGGGMQGAMQFMAALKGPNCLSAKVLQARSSYGTALASRLVKDVPHVEQAVDPETSGLYLSKPRQ